MGLRSDAKYWVALLRAPGVGPGLARKLLDHFGSAEAIFSGDRQRLQALGCKGEAVDWLREPQWALCQPDLGWAEQDGHHFITCHDPEWPERLHNVNGAPIALYALGDLDLIKLPQLAIVGSRNPTAAGKNAALDFGKHLSQQGIVVTSGMALGIDAAAHEGALQSGGLTIAVCGTGLDRVYPKRNHALAKQIAANGLLLSEFTIGTPVLAHNFPKRNRIISGLSLGTLVVEAAVRSGSLITARYATEQGREVFAMPGSIHNPLARGCHKLIRDGAKLVENAEHILEELAPHLGDAGRQLAAQVSVPAEELVLHDSPLMKHIEYDPVSADYLIERTGLTAAEVSSMLVMLELEGAVIKTAAGEYQRK